MRYEVFYGTGGHEGPFSSEIEAANHAIRIGELKFVVSAYSAGGVAGYLPLQMYMKRSDKTFEVTGFARLRDPEIPLVFRWMRGPIGGK